MAAKRNKNLTSSQDKSGELPGTTAGEIKGGVFGEAKNRTKGTLDGSLKQPRGDDGSSG